MIAEQLKLTLLLYLKFNTEVNFQRIGRAVFITQAIL